MSFSLPRAGKQSKVLYGLAPDATLPPGSLFPRTTMTITRLLYLGAVLFIFASPAQAYIDTAPTLGRVLNDSTNVVVLQVEKVSKERRVIIYRKVADLKGVFAADHVKHGITDGLHHSEPRLI